jgi:predicted nucleic acid-binding protein
LALYVVDANVVVQASIDAAGLGPLTGHDLIAPPLMPSEALSALAEMYYRGDVSAELANAARSQMGQLPYELRRPAELMDTAWSVARQLGWAKTYDAEYVALAQLVDCPLVTLDGRLIRGARRVVRVIGPGEVPKAATEHASEASQDDG